MRRSSARKITGFRLITIRSILVPVVAHRTSPTNMGLALLSNLSAYDFGYIVAGQLIERTENAFKTMEALEKHRGHFYNWYDTQTLKPLLPTYISSVDSGNLAGSLLTLRPGLLALPDQKILGASLFDGLSDTMRILVDATEGTAPALSSPAFRGIRSQRIITHPILLWQHGSALNTWQRPLRNWSP